MVFARAANLMVEAAGRPPGPPGAMIPLSGGRRSLPRRRPLSLLFRNSSDYPALGGPPNLLSSGSQRFAAETSKSRSRSASTLSLRPQSKLQGRDATCPSRSVLLPGDLARRAPSTGEATSGGQTCEARMIVPRSCGELCLDSPNDTLPHLIPHYTYFVKLFCVT